MKKSLFILMLLSTFVFSYGKSYLQNFGIKGFETSSYPDIKIQLLKITKKYSGCNIARNRVKSNHSKLAIICNVRSKVTLKRFYYELIRKIKYRVSKGRLVTKKL